MNRSVWGGFFVAKNCESVIIAAKYIIFCIMRIDFFICRHGQTDKNVEGVWHGCKIDVMLNETGQRQAEELAKKLRFKIMDVYSSPMVRAVQTANVIAKTNARGCDVVIMQDLRECDFGEAEGVSFVEIQLARSGRPIYLPLRPKYFADGSYSTPILPSNGSTST